MKKRLSRVLSYAMILALFLFVGQVPKVYADELPMLINIDTAVDGITLSGNIHFGGWAIGANGIQKVEMSVDSAAKELMTYGGGRADVAAAYPTYQNSANSGFDYTVNTRKYSNGTHILAITATGNDGNVYTIQKNITVYNTQTPIMGQPIVSKAQAIKYFLNNNNVKGYDYVSNFVDIVWEEGAIEGIKPDVAFAQMMKETNFLKFTGEVKEEQNNFAGIGATGGVPGNSFPDIRTGIRAVIQHLKAYATKDALKQDVVDPRYSLVPKASAPYVEWLGKAANPTGAGWAPSETYGTNIVERVAAMKSIVILNSAPASVTYFKVGSEFIPGRAYTISGKAKSDNTTLYQFWIKDYSSGAWTLVQDYSENGNFIWEPLKAGSYRIKMNVKDAYSLKDFDNFVYKDVIAAESTTPDKTSAISGMTIVVDPGHNYIGEEGAIGRFTSGTYYERVLNLQIANKVKTELEKLGANVIMTSKDYDTSDESKSDPLKRRTDVANAANADLFISLHHNASTSTSAAGIETHYSTYKPGIDNSDIIVQDDIYYDTTPSNAAIISRDLAQKLVDGLSSLGYTNRGSRDHNLYVTKNTNMPAVLIELGFVTNEAEAQKCSDSSDQQNKAEKIAQIINDYYSQL